MKCNIACSSVAIGGGGGRIGLKSMLNTIAHWPEEHAKKTVFGTFEADFCTKNEKSPLPNGIGDGNWSRI